MLNVGRNDHLDEMDKAEEFREGNKIYVNKHEFIFAPIIVKRETGRLDNPGCNGRTANYSRNVLTGIAEA